MNKKKLSKDKLKLLEGLEDIYELMLEDDEESPKSKVTKDKLADSYELYNFLESELMRLKKLDLIFSEGIPNLAKNPQHEAMSIEMETRLFAQIEELQRELSATDSPLWNRLDLWWKQAFSSVLRD